MDTIVWSMNVIDTAKIMAARMRFRDGHQGRWQLSRCPLPGDFRVTAPHSLRDSRRSSPVSKWATSSERESRLGQTGPPSVGVSMSVGSPIGQDTFETHEQLSDNVLLDNQIAPGAVTDVGDEAGVSEHLDVVADGGLRQ